MTAWLTSQDVQNYGADFVDFSQRAAAHALGGRLDALGQQNAALEQQLAIERRALLDQAVAAAVPDYMEIDSDPRWHDWLRQTDPLNGVPRQHLLDQAIAAGSAHRVVAIFNSFRHALAGSGGHTARSPGRPRSALSGSADGGRIWTRAQVKEAYEAHRKGRLVGDAWNRIEREIVNAGAQGRIAGAVVDLAGK